MLKRGIRNTGKREYMLIGREEKRGKRKRREQ